MIDAVHAPLNPRRWWILANVSIGTFMATLDGSIANVALPTISGSLHISLQSVQWVVTAYLLTISSLLPLVGKISDAIGKGRVYNVGFIVFSIGSLLCSLSPTITWLILSRIAQAFGAALLMANSQGIVAQTFGTSERGRALGITGMMVSLGSLAGPAIGGLLIDSLGWPSIFWVNVPIGIIGFVFSLWILPKEKGTRIDKSFDFVGSLLFMLGIVILLYTISNGESWGWASLQTLVALAVSMLLLMAFLLQERRAKDPMLDLSLYKIRTFSAGTGAGFLSFISLFTTTIMIPFYMQEVLHFSATTVGLAMVANPLVMVVVAPLSGWLSDHIGSVALATGGLIINALGFISLSLLGSHVGFWLIALHLAVFGLGQGMFQSPNNSSIMASVPRTKLGIAGGFNALVRNLGMVVGIAMSVALFNGRLHAMAHLHPALAHSSAGFVEALHTVFWASAITSLAGAALSLLRNRKNQSPSLEA